jgi:hypothetical protein
MALVFPYVNQSKAANDYIGRQWFRLKEAMVAAGWTVRASSDGAARFAFDTTETSTATAGGATTLTDGAQSWVTNVWATGTVTIVSGTGAGQTRTISSNTGTVLTVSSAWTTNPNATSVYRLSKTAATPGSGGSYDVWVSGNVRTNSTPATAGDAGNTYAWCLLENRGATCLRQVLLQTTSGTGVGAAGWSGYGNLVYNAGITGNQSMTGLAAAYQVAPGAGPNEQILWGSRDSAGTDIFGWTTAGYYHIWYDDTPGADGGLTVGIIAVDTATENARYIIFGALDVDSSHASDEDPFVILTNTSTPSGGGSPAMYGWDQNTTAMVTINGGLGSPWYGAGDTIASTDSICQMPCASTVGGSAYGKGRISKSACMISCYARNWGDRGTDQNGRVFVEMGNTGGMLVPWVLEATAPLPGANTTRDFWDVTADAATPVVTYYAQRVFSSGLSQWCYYTTSGAPDPAPASGSTTPNWTGSITAWQILGSY